MRQGTKQKEQSKSTQNIIRNIYKKKRTRCSWKARDCLQNDGNTKEQKVISTGHWISHNKWLWYDSRRKLIWMKLCLLYCIPRERCELEELLNMYRKLLIPDDINTQLIKHGRLIIRVYNALSLHVLDNQENSRWQQCTVPKVISQFIKGHRITLKPTEAFVFCIQSWYLDDSSMPSSMFFVSKLKLHIESPHYSNFFIQLLISCKVT